MVCIYCNIGKLKTYNTIDSKYATIRYKKCIYCGANYKSVEKLTKGDKNKKTSEEE